MEQSAGKHDPISVLFQAVERLHVEQREANKAIFEQIGKTNDKVDKLSEIVGQQALLFERLTTIETNHKDSIKRMYREIERYDAENKKRFEAIDKRVTNMEKAPTVALGKVGNAILVVLGTGIGAWILYKFGIEVEQ